MSKLWIGLLALPAMLAACAGPDPSPTPTPVPTGTPTPVPPTATPLPPTPTQAPPTATPTTDWDLVWADEFDAPDGASPDPERWSFNTGGGGWGNGERQYYTDRAENAVIEDGVLRICAREEEEPYRGYRYTSARLVTKRKGDWTYGRFEVRARLPAGQGVWPAIWMLPSHMAYGGWPMGGEIDIMEMVGHDPIRVHGTLHYGDPHTYTGHYYVLRTGDTFADDFHTFSLEWEPGEIRWYVDGYYYQTQTEWFTSKLDAEYPAPFDRPFHLLLNVAVGGRWPGNPDETTEFPECMAVDYVRVYQSPELAE